MALNFARDTFAPSFQIRINGQAMPREITDFITNIEVEDNLDMMDKITLSMGTQSVIKAEQVQSLIDDKIFLEGNLIEVFLGYGAELRSVSAGEIVRLEPTFPRDGIPSLSVIAYDITHRMSDHKPEKGVPYKDFRDSQIASIIGERNGIFIRKSDPSTFAHIRRTKGIHNRIQKKGKNDFEFLREVADFNGYEFFVRYVKVGQTEQKRWVLFFEPSNDQGKPTFTFTYNVGAVDQDTLLEFTPDMNVKDQNIEFEIISFNKEKVKTVKRERDKEFRFNPVTKDYDFKKFEDRKFKGPKKADQIKKSVDKPGAIKFKAFGKTREIVVSKLKNEDDAKRAVEAWIKKRKENFIKGTGSVIGLEVLQAGQVVGIAGVGKTFTGNYVVTKVVHKFGESDPPYQCDLDLRKVVR